MERKQEKKKERQTTQAAEPVKGTVGEPTYFFAIKL